MTLGSNPNYTVTKTDSTLTVVSKTTTLTVTASSVQYSDHTTLTATISPASLGDEDNTGSGQFSIDGVTVGSPVTVIGGVATLDWIITKKPDTYPNAVSANFTSTNPNFTGADNTYNLVVTQEDAYMEFTKNPIAVKVLADGGPNEAFKIEVTITQDDDGDDGDLSKIEGSNIKISFKPVGGGSGPEVAAESFVVAEDGKSSVATFIIEQDELGVETYTAEVTLANDWFTADPVEDVLVVYDPSLGFTSGGGWFYWPEDENNPELTDAKTNFGFTMKYNKKATNIQGSLLLIAHLVDGSMYRIKSNALYGLAIGENIDDGYGWASFSGKCTYRWPVGEDYENTGGQEFIFYVQDWDDPGAGADRIWFTVLFNSNVPDENQVLTLDDDGDKVAVEEELEFIDGGNIVVPHTPKKGGNPHN